MNDMKLKKIKYNILYKYTVLVVLLALTISSCTKFLEEVPSGSMTTAAKLQSAESGDALVIGPYRSLNLWLGGADDWGHYLIGPIEYQTGLAYTPDSHVQFWKYQGDQVAGDLLGAFTNFWNNQYQGVRDCNLSISLIPGITGYTDAQKAAALGEVRALRAWYFYTLVRYFGDVPMTTSVITDITKFEAPRVSLKTIYDEVIIPDLEYAVSTESGLTDTRSTGRVTKHVARAILADVYLTCAGYPYQEVETNPTANWCADGLWSAQTYPVNSVSAKDFLAKAKVQLDVLVNSGTYTLGTYADLRTPAKNNTGEAIFQAQFLTGVVGSGQIGVISAPLGSQVVSGDGNGTWVPSMEYYNSYDPADLRKQEKQFFYTWEYKHSGFDPNMGPSATFVQPHLYKWYDWTAMHGNGSSSLNWPFYRYADILLMQTEVNWTLNQLGTAVAAADIVSGINKVRARALLPALTGATCDLKAIMSERAYELIFESKMLWDQRRTRRSLREGSGRFTSLDNFIGFNPTIFSFAFTAKHLLSPIGMTEIQYNSKCLQNFGYLPKQVGQ